jgi:hypothetical protein
LGIREISQVVPKPSKLRFFSQSREQLLSYWPQ